MAEADRSVQVNLRLPQLLKEAAEKAAAADHRSLTSLVEKLLSDHVTTKPIVEEWHERACARFGGILAEKLPTAFFKGSFVRSYSILTRQTEEISPDQLIRLLHIIHVELSNFLSNPEMLYPYSRAELAPYFTFDPELTRGAFSEILESVGLPPVVRFPEFWRVSSAGLVSDARGHAEDYLNIMIGKQKGNWFSPLFMTRRLYGLIQHAYLFAEKFKSATSVVFRCEWTGLLEREMRDHEAGFDYRPGNIAKVDGRVTAGEWPVSAVRMEWPEIASALGGPILRLFDPTFAYTPEWIRQQMRKILGWDERAGLAVP